MISSLDVPMTCSRGPEIFNLISGLGNVISFHYSILFYLTNFTAGFELYYIVFKNGKLTALY
jgi:hypothetical protein